mmetsp:Transcript_44069/g.91745  ORF Transcript_44069/g.91745 Transcript_44069/m.91745 type:complete len:130 (+) Transcript_44069:1344-1733(+)
MTATTTTAMTTTAMKTTAMTTTTAVAFDELVCIDQNLVCSSRKKSSPLFRRIRRSGSGTKPATLVTCKGYYKRINVSYNFLVQQISTSLGCIILPCCSEEMKIETEIVVLLFILKGKKCKCNDQTMEYS